MVLSTLTGFLMLASLSVGLAAAPEVARAAGVAGARGANRAATLLALAGTALLAAGYGAMTALAAPVALAWGLAGLWWLMAATNGVLVVLQGAGFRRHSAKAGTAPVGA